MNNETDPVLVAMFNRRSDYISGPNMSMPMTPVVMKADMYMSVDQKLTQLIRSVERLSSST